MGLFYSLQVFILLQKVQNRTALNDIERKDVVDMLSLQCQKRHK